MTGALRAGALYAALVFAAGFALGALRVFVVAPRLGPVAAVLVELPLMLALSWHLAGRLTLTPAGRMPAAHRVVMGETAFALLMAAEVALGLALGQSVAAIIAHFATPEGAIGLAGQLAFGAMPLLRGPLGR